ncbi:MAG TPA: hypothetical protein V6D17_01260 [Candidatus Obscuribacterales bacterium]
MQQFPVAKKYSIYSLSVLKDSWILSLKQFFPLFGAWLVSLGGPILILVLGVFGGLAIDHLWGFKHAGPATLVGILLPGLFIGCFWAGWALVSLKIARRLPVRMRDLIRPPNQMLSALVALCITSTLIGLGMFLIVPGALLFLKWQLAPYYIIDRNYGPIQALKESWRDTDQLFVPLGILDLIFFGLHTLSSVTIFGPVMCHMALAVATALVYNNWLGDENLIAGEIEAKAKETH